jgi:hypothetical protein
LFPLSVEIEIIEVVFIHIHLIIRFVLADDGIPVCVERHRRVHGFLVLVVREKRDA